MSALTPYPECGLRQTTVDFTSARALGLVCRLEGEGLWVGTKQARTSAVSVITRVARGIDHSGMNQLSL